jgi:hypothetical protein
MVEVINALFPTRCSRCCAGCPGSRLSDCRKTSMRRVPASASNSISHGPRRNETISTRAAVAPFDVEHLGALAVERRPHAQPMRLAPLGVERRVIAQAERCGAFHLQVGAFHNSRRASPSARPPRLCWFAPSTGARPRRDAVKGCASSNGIATVPVSWADKSQGQNLVTLARRKTSPEKNCSERNVGGSARPLGHNPRKNLSSLIHSGVSWDSGVKMSLRLILCLHFLPLLGTSA